MVFTLSGMLFVGFGLAAMFAQDAVWALTSLGGNSRRHATERTDAWESGMTICGAVAVLIGIVLMFS